MQEQFYKKLRSAFDLNIYEAKIWTALLSKGVSTAGELADISSVPRSRSYDVLESLEKRGFIIIKLGKPIRYLAVQPEEILKRIKKGVAQAAEENIQLLDTVKSEPVFKELALLYTQGVTHVDPSTLSSALKGRNNIMNHIETMLENAEKSVIVMTTKDGFIRKINEFSKIFKKLNDKGVKIRIAAPLDEEAKSVAKEFKDYADIRNLSKVNARFVIVDGTDIFFMIDSDKNIHEKYDTGIWVKTPYFAKAFEAMFNNTWSQL